MNRNNATHSALVALVIVLCVPAMTLNGQSPTDAATDAQPTAGDELAAEQSQLADKFSRLENLILRMAEYDSAQNPRRAALLKQAITLTQEKHMHLQLETLVRFLNDGKLSRAVDNQKQVRDDLQQLLELLLSENREDRLQDEQKRILRYIKEVERLLRLQRDVQGRTEGGADNQQLAQTQQRIADRTQQLDRTIGENEEENAPDENDGASDGQSPDEDTNPDSEDPDSQDTPAENGEDENGSKPKDEDLNAEKSSEGQQPTDDQQKGEQNGKPQENSSPTEGKSESPSSESPDSKPQEGDPNSSQNKGQNSPAESQDQSQSQPADPSQQNAESQNSQEQQSAPARKKLQEAERRMREAQQRLEEARRKEAVEEQEEARRALEAAKAELEEILRQLREEEIERTLALLESRFRKMLEMQIKVYENTVRLSKVSVDRRDRQVDLEATKLSFQQRRIVMEADKCLALLREEGSSVAFPESVEQMRDDMDQVVERLGRTKIDRITQGIEEDIIEALDEMLEALQQAQQDQEERRQQPPQQSPPSSPQDQPLVDQIAELKMLRALQIRINKRTTRYSRLLDDADDPAGQATDEELVDALQQLAEREARLQEITRDVVLGRNR